MGKLVRIGVVGLGKMGLSHFAIVNAHPDTETCASDASRYAEVLRTRQLRVIAMSVFASGAIPAEEAISFGALSRANIRKPVEHCGAPIPL